MGLNGKEQLLLKELGAFIRRNLDTFSLVGDYPPHNIPPWKATSISQFASLDIANGVRGRIVQFAVPAGFAFRWLEYGVNSEDVTNYDHYLMNEETAIDPWNPVPAAVQAAVANQFCTVLHRRTVPLWFKGPVTVAIDVLNNDVDDTFHGHILGWMMSDSLVPDSEINFYRGAK